MTDNTVYLSAIKQLAEQGLSIRALVDAGSKLEKNGSPDLALDLYRRWIAAEPENPALHLILFNSAMLLRDRGELSAAQEALEHAVSLNPNFAHSRSALADLYEKLGDGRNAISQRIAIADQPTVISGKAVASTLNAIKGVGRILQAGRQHAALAAMLRRGLEIDPGDREMIQILVSLRLQQCEWPVTAAAGVAQKTLLSKMGPFQLSLYTDDPLLHLAAAWDYNREMVGYHLPCPDVRPRPADPGRLRIGYLSADLTSHSTGYLMTEVFELHDRRQVEVFAYYCGHAADDPTKTRIRTAAEHWIDIGGMDDVTAAQRIAADGIDILVDLHGYTRGARSRLLATRPAPVIVNWLAYPGTLGSPYHHYIIADDWIIPPEHEIYYAEKVVRLPCYQPNDRKRVIAPEPPTRAEAGLPDDAMVYCCFNGSVKISRFCFDRWMTILGRVPGSVLWLLDGGDETRKQLLAYAVQRGIAAERIVFGPVMPRARHLARYVLADLFLDTAPCGAHTTASDALWMGVPILTLSGQGFASRVGGSLARAAGLPEAVCSSVDEYVERAVALGKDRTELQRQKTRLASTRDTCSLFDMEGLVRELEACYRDMWREFHQGQLPRPDLRNLDVYFEIGIEQDHDAVEMLALKDYRGWYRERLAERHRRCPIPEDSRLWTAAEIARTEAGDISLPKIPRKAGKPRVRKAAPKAKKQRRK